MSFDAIVVGTGQAGSFLVARLAGAGRKVAVVEEHSFGGTCSELLPTILEDLVPLQ